MTFFLRLGGWGLMDFDGFRLVKGAVPVKDAWDGCHATVVDCCSSHW